jgi:hypothetical protein
VDRRSRHRYAISLPVRFKAGETPTTVIGAGTILNFSSGGIAFVSDKAFTRGTWMRLSIDWPALLNGVIRIMLVVEGVVVRSEGQFSAISITRYEFRTQRK